MKSASEYLSQAKMTLTGRWGDAIVTSLLIGVVMVGASIIPFGGVLIGGPIYLGAAIWALKFSQNSNYEYNDIFKGFDNFANALIAALLVGILVLIGFVFLIIPGIIIALGLSQTFYILAEDKDISATDAMSKSWEMMKGNKGNLMVIYIFFILLTLLLPLTLFIGLFFLIPFQRIVLTHFYEDLRGPLDGEIELIGAE